MSCFETTDTPTGDDIFVDQVFPALGQLPAGAIVTEKALADIFKKHPVSIRRAVDRGELPRPTRLMGKPIWTIAVIRRHIERRLRDEAANHEKLPKL